MAEFLPAVIRAISVLPHCPALLSFLLFYFGQINDDDDDDN